MFDVWFVFFGQGKNVASIESIIILIVEYWNKKDSKIHIHLKQ